MFFFDSTNSIIVEADAIEVSNAVLEFIRNRPAPGIIRNRAILDIQKKRHGFISYVDRLILEHGGFQKNHLYQNWDKIFTDQLLETKPIEKIITECNQYC